MPHQPNLAQTPHHLLLLAHYIAVITHIMQSFTAIRILVEVGWLLLIVFAVRAKVRNDTRSH